MFSKELQNIGLSEKEAGVYIASLEMGPDTAQNIAKKAGIKRATTYVQIESLKKKGLMSEFEKGKKTFYAAETPERLSGLLRVFHTELELKKGDLNSILPSLLEMFAGGKERPKVRFYEGRESIQTIFEDFLRTKNKVIEGFVNLDELDKLFPKRISNYSPRRHERGIHGNIIYTRKDGPLEGYSDPTVLRTAKFIPFQKFPIATDITIYDDKIALMPYAEAKPVGIIIENKEISQTLRAIFYMLWAILE